MSIAVTKAATVRLFLFVEVGMIRKPDTTRRMLRAARILCGYDQAQLARAVRLKQPDISYFETGRRTPSIKDAEKIAKALGSDPSVLFPEVFKNECGEEPHSESLERQERARV